MTAITVLDIHGGIGKAAIYTTDSLTPTDTGPLTNPTRYLSRVFFHTDFTYPRVVQDFQTSVSLANIPAATTRNQRIVLSNHGLAGVPVVFGAVYVPTVGWCPLSVGTYLWSINTVSGAVDGAIGGQTLSLGADATSILLYENGIAGFSATQNIPAKSVTIRVIVTDQLL